MIATVPSRVRLPTADADALVRGAFAEAFAPRERIDAAEWAEKYRTVETGAMPGAWSFDRTPYLRGVHRAYSDPHVRQVTVIKAEQVGGTEAVFNCLFYAIDQRPGDRLFVYPNQDVARAVNKRRLQPSMRACTRIVERMGQARGDQGNLEQVFTDGSVCRFAGSNSDANLEVFSARDVIIDELDRCVDGIIGKVRGRRNAYPDAKLYCNGTASLEGVGIDAEYADSDRCRWWTPCPACDAWHVRDDFARVKWPCPEGLPFDAEPDEVERLAWMCCPECDHRINPHEHRKTSVRGFWLPSGWVPARVDEAKEAGPVLTRGAPDPSLARGALQSAPGGQESGAVRVRRLGPGERSESGADRLLHDWVRRDIPEGLCAVWVGDPDREGYGRGDGPPPASSHAGFHIWGMMSTIVRNPFGNVAREFVERRGGVSNEWANRRLGRAHRQHGSRVERAELRRLCVPVAEGGYRMGECPRGTLVLTCAVDIQHNRAYCVVRGWGELGRDTGLVWCEEVPIDAEAGQMGAIRDVLKMRFPMRDDRDKSLPIGATAIDSGHWSDRVYDLTSALRNERFPNVFAVKGEGSTKVIVPTREVTIGEVTGIERHKRNQHPLLVLKVNYWKQASLGRIRGEEVLSAAENPAVAEAVAADNAVGRFLLPEDAPEEYLLQLTSEERVVRMVNGQPAHIFVPRPGMDNRNHYWDCECYGEALAARVGVPQLTESGVQQIRAKIAARTGATETKPTVRQGLLNRPGRGMLDRGR